MATPVIESSATNSATAASSVTITKPTGLAEGDLMLVQLAATDIGGLNRTWTTPSGWTLIQAGGTSRLARPAAYYKIASAGDAAASDFTFSMSGTLTAISGCLMRITGFAGSPITLSEIDQSTGSVTALTFTTNLTPAADNSLLVFAYMGTSNAFSGTPTIASYASTPSSTWTEVADVGVIDGSNDGHGFGVAYSNYSGVSTITSRTATISQTSTTDYAGIAVIVNGIVDATGTHTLVSTTSTTFSNTGIADTTASHSLATATSASNAQTGSSNAPTQWTNEASPSTTWTNESSL